MGEFEIGDKVAGNLMKLSADPQKFLSSLEHKTLDMGYHPDIKVTESAEYMQAHQAQIKTAENTEVMKTQLETVIDNQNDYIKILREQSEHTMQVLENIFASTEDNVVVQKEMLKIMSEKGIDHELLKDKGIDVIIQILLPCFKILLAKYGLNF